MMYERVLLQTIKFDLQVEHPYPSLLKFGKALRGMYKASLQIAQEKEDFTCVYLLILTLWFDWRLILKNLQKFQLSVCKQIALCKKSAKRAKRFHFHLSGNTIGFCLQNNWFKRMHDKLSRHTLFRIKD